MKTNRFEARAWLFLLAFTSLSFSSAQQPNYRLEAPARICKSPSSLRICGQEGAVWVDFKQMLERISSQKVSVEREKQGDAPGVRTKLDNQDSTWWRLEDSGIFFEKGRWYAPLYVALQQRNLKTEVRLKSLQPPQLEVKAGSQTQTLTFKGADLVPVLEELASRQLNWDGFTSTPYPVQPYFTLLYRQSLEPSKAGDLYALIEPMSFEQGVPTLTLSLGQVDPQGQLELRATRRKLRFQTDLSALKTIREGEAVVVRLSGRLDRDLFDPSSVLIPQPSP